MRLFYAINFPSAVKDKLTCVQTELRKQTQRANFALQDNLHLTLVFVGEVPESRSGVLCDIAHQLKFEPFELRLQGVGSFRRDGGDIVWVGVKENSCLQYHYRSLAEHVRNAGFHIEARRFTPHMTLAREVKFCEGFNLPEFSKRVDPITTVISKVSLMKSERIGGRLIYTEIC